MRNLIHFGFLVTVLLYPGLLAGQRGCDSLESALSTVSADLNKRQIDAIPFSVPFTIRMPLPKVTPLPGANDPPPLDSVALRYAPAVEVDGQWEMGELIARETRYTQGVVAPTELVFGIQPLDPRDFYYFEFRTFAGPLVDTTVLRARPVSGFANHFDADVGVVHAPSLGYWGVGSSSHFYFRRINPQECAADYRGADHILKRLSVFAGLSVFELDSDESVDNLWEIGSPMVGVGLNRLPLPVPLRVNSGIIWLRQDDPDPAVTRQHIEHTYFVGVSIDVELNTLLGPLAALAGGS